MTKKNLEFIILIEIIVKFVFLFNEAKMFS